MVSPRTLALFCGFFLASLSPPSWCAADAARQPTSLPRVMPELLQEATAAWSRNNPWPRKTLSYAEEKWATLDSTEVSKMLARRISATPAIDAYVKWQLLSFAPQLDNLDIPTCKQIVATLPELLAQPQPTLPDPDEPNDMTLTFGRQIALVQPRFGPGGLGYHLDVLTTGSGISVGGAAGSDPRYATLNIRATQANLIELRCVVADANMPAYALRDRLAQILPRQNGIRLYLLVTDLKQRVLAGDPSVEKLAALLVRESRAAAPPAAIAAELRPLIVGGLRELSRLTTPVIKSLRVDADHRLIVQQQDIRLPPQSLAAILENLQMQDILNY